MLLYDILRSSVITQLLVYKNFTSFIFFNDHNRSPFYIQTVDDAWLHVPQKLEPQLHGDKVEQQNFKNLINIIVNGFALNQTSFHQTFDYKLHWFWYQLKDWSEYNTTYIIQTCIFDFDTNWKIDQSTTQHT